MNKKIIALLLVVALAVSGAFAFGIGGMYSNVVGTAALTVAPQGHEGVYIGAGWAGWGNHVWINVSGEYKFWEWYFIDGDFFNWGLQAGAGADVGLGFGSNWFVADVGVYGFFGTNIYLAFDKKFGIELFGQWQPNLFVHFGSSGFGFGRYWWGSWYNMFYGHAAGIRFWF
ncbi:MAG: hypothetical protein K6G52_02795 [Treponemataceae bacterium]|nr:hypothetical protein [Treponemataceae bacterium]